MRGQSQLDFRTRKSAKRHASEDIHHSKNKLVDSETSAKAFRPVQEITHKPAKVQKPVVSVRKSGRLASKNLTQTRLNLEKNDETVDQVNTQKRKSTITPSDKTKKQKTIHSPKTTTTNGNVTKTIVEESVSSLETVVAEKVISKDVEQKVITKDVEQKVIANDVEPKVIANDVEPKVITKSVEQAVINKHVEQTTMNQVVEKVVTKEPEMEAAIVEKKVEKNTVVHDNTKQHDINSEKYIVHTPVDDDNHDEILDSPSPPSYLTEPSTPPVHLEVPSAPFKTYLTEADKSRIEYEKSTLEKLRKALDIVITDRIARNVPCLYHQIEPVLRNSTRRTITLSHICKVMYIAPKLYALDVKELRNFGGKVTEAFLVQFGKEWSIPLAGKDLQKRSDILKNALIEYFDTHREPDASIPEIKLPRLSKIVDRKEWINDVKLPPGVKQLLQAHEKAKADEIESQKPKPKPVGSVKDRMAALKARLAEKKANK